MGNQLDRYNKYGGLSPLFGLTSLQRDISRIFEDFLHPLSGEPMKSMEPVYDFVPTLDVKTSEKEYTFKLDIPGVDKNDVKIEVVDNSLVISGERKEEKKEDEKNRYFYESRYGMFQRSIPLPSDVDADKIEADFENGVLRIDIPRVQATQARKISIGAKSAEQTQQKSSTAKDTNEKPESHVSH